MWNLQTRNLDIYWPCHGNLQQVLMVFLFTKKLTTCFCFHFLWYFKVSLFILEEKWQAVADTHIVSEQTDNKVYNWVIKSHKKGNMVNCQLPINGMGDTWSLVSRWFDKSPSMLLLFQFMLIATCTYLSFLEHLAKQIEVYQFLHSLSWCMKSCKTKWDKNMFSGPLHRVRWVKVHAVRGHDSPKTQG